MSEDIIDLKHVPHASEKRKHFLQVLAKTGVVLIACKESGLNRYTVYHWKRNNEKFAAAWDRAVEDSIDALEAEARRRAFHGVDRPIYYKGEKVGEVKEYSDLLLIFLLRGRRPDVFRDRPIVFPSSLASDGRPDVSGIYTKEEWHEYDFISEKIGAGQKLTQEEQDMWMRLSAKKIGFEKKLLAGLDAPRDVNGRESKPTGA